MRAVSLALLLVLAGLGAGCTDKLSLSSVTGGGDGPFSVSPDKGDAGTTFHVETGASGDVTWDFGDGTTATGRSADHKYGFSNGVMTITMIATGADGKQTISTKTVTLGTGANRPPTVSVSASPSWAEVRKAVNLTARGNDMDKDPISYLWTYRIVSGGVASDGHDHVHEGAPAPTAQEFVLPGADKTNSVTFDAPGKYVVKVRASDPKGGSATSETKVDVSKHIPDSVLDVKFSGTLVAGTGGQASASEKLWTTPAPDTFVDAARHPYQLLYPGTTVIILTWNDTSGQGAFDLDLELRNADNGTTIFRSQTRAPAPAFEFNFTQQPPGSYEVVVRNVAGAQVKYDLLVHATLTITPELVAKAEGA